MPRVVIDFERCKGCGLCVEVCPNDVLGPLEKINLKGVHPITALKPEECTGCKLCAIVCPDVAITIYEK